MANYSPEIPNFPVVNPFLPCYGKFDLTTYIQGASDYEIMANLVQLYNTMAKGYNDVQKLSTDTATAFNQLQDFVNNIFVDKDLNATLTNVLDNMAKNGTLEQYFAQFFVGSVTPEMFGAVGDGITDDHNAMQAAINYASDNGLTLTIPSKNYAIKETLNITKRVTISGATSPELWIEGSPCPTLTFLLSGTKPAIKVDYYKDSDYKNTTTPPNTDHVVIKNLKITGNNQTFCGIVTRCYLSYFENLTIERFTIGVYTHQTYKVNFDNVTTFYCDVGFFIGDSTYFNTNLIDCWCQYNNTIQNNTNASKLINEALSEKFYDEKITGIYVYNSQCRLIRFSTEAVFYGIYATDGADIEINDCGIELIPNEGYGIIASGELNPSTIICDNASFWNNESYTGRSAFCGYRNTVIITNASTTNFGEAKQSSNVNSCLIFKTVDGDRYVPVQVSGLTGATVTDNRSRYNGNGTFTYDFILNYTNHDTSKPIKIIGGPTLGVEGDVAVLNTNYIPMHFFSEAGTLTTSSAHTIFAYPESGTRLYFTVKYKF